MDHVIEKAEFERQQDEEFWENKRRDEQQPRRARSQRDPAGTEASSDRPSRDEQPAREQPTPDAVHHCGSTIDGPIKQKKTGKPVLTGAVVLLLLLSAAAIFMLWSSDGLPFAKKKSAAPTVNALGGIGAEVVSAGLPATTPLADPALPAITPVPAAPVPVAPQDPKLQEQLDRLEKRMDQLVAGFKAQGYIKDTAGNDGAELLATDFLPHPSTLPPPAPVAATTKVSAVVTPRRMAVRRAVARPAPAIPKPSHQLLSVDMWDGRPSVVVGVPGADAGQVRVLQPGDTYNGVTLTEVDVAGQRATFSNGGRSVSIGVERQP